MVVYFDSDVIESIEIMIIMILITFLKEGSGVKKAVNGRTTISITSIFVLVIGFVDGRENRGGIWI